MISETVIYDLLTVNFTKVNNSLESNNVKWIKNNNTYIHKDLNIKRKAGALVLFSNNSNNDHNEIIGLIAKLETKLDAWYKIKIRCSTSELHMVIRDCIVTDDKIVLNEELLQCSSSFKNVNNEINLKDVEEKQSEKAEAVITVTNAIINTDVIEINNVVKDIVCNNGKSKEYNEYVLYFKAVSQQSLVIINNSDEIWLTDFVISEFEVQNLSSLCVSYVLNQGIIYDFPLADLYNMHLSKDLRKFGIGIYPETVDLIYFSSSKYKHLRMSLYIMKILGIYHLYMKDLIIDLLFDYSTYLLEFNIELEYHKALYNKTIINNSTKIPIKIMQISNYLSPNPNQDRTDGILELRKEGLALIYYSDLLPFFPNSRAEQFIYSLLKKT